MTFYLSFFVIFFFSCLKLKSSWMQSLEKNFFGCLVRALRSHISIVLSQLCCMYVCMYFTRLAQSSRCLTLQSETKLQQNWNSFAFYSFVLFCLKLEPSWNASFKKCVGCLVRALRSDLFGLVELWCTYVFHYSSLEFFLCFYAVDVLQNASSHVQEKLQLVIHHQKSCEYGSLSIAFLFEIYHMVQVLIVLLCFSSGLGFWNIVGSTP